MAKKVQISASTPEEGLMIVLQKISEYKKNEKQNSISLKNLLLTKIPDEIFELTDLKSLYVGMNNITEFPEDLTKLKNLTSFHAPKCGLTEFPAVLLKMPHLQAINLTQNQIKNIPDDIDLLVNLRELSLGTNNITELPDSITKITSLRDLNLSANDIQELPSNMVDLVNLRSIILTKNPIKFLDDDKRANLSGNNAVVQVLRYFMALSKATEANNDKRFHSHIDFNKDIKTAFYQYLVYFNSYVEKTKGKDFDILVEDVSSGLIISGYLEYKEDIISYLQEFIGFIREKVESIDPVFERQVSNNEKELTLIELRNQVRHLTSQLELKSLENRMLNGEISRLMEIIGTEKRNPAPILIQNISQSHSNAVATNTIDFKVELSGLQNNFLEAKNELHGHLNDAQRHEIETIDSELIAIDESASSDNVNRTPFKRIKRIFEQLNNPDSEWAKAVSGTKKGIELLQSLGKKYNKIAPWLVLPSIPDVLL